MSFTNLSVMLVTPHNLITAVDLTRSTLIHCDQIRLRLTLVVVIKADRSTVRMFKFNQSQS